jgi:hypothetical protein
MNKDLTKPEIKNFYEYLNKKYLRINQKINRRKSKLEQLGGAGTSIAQLQMDLAQLEVLKDIIRKKIDTGDKVDFEKISGPLKVLVDDLGEFAKKINEKMDVPNDVDLGLVLNQMDQVQKFITRGEENYLDIKLQNMPKMVHPPISIPAISDGYTEILESVDSQIKQLVEKINSKGLESQADFMAKLENLNRIIQNLDEKTTQMIDTTKLVQLKIDEIDTYTDMELSVIPDEEKMEYKAFLNSEPLTVEPASFKKYDIRPEFFFPPSDNTMNETINIEKLESVTILEPGKLATEISAKFDTVISDIKIEGKTLVSPDYLKISNRELLIGGDNIYLHTKSNVKQVMNELLCRWHQQIKLLKNSITEKRIEVEPLIESKTLIELIEQLKKDKLVILTENISKLSQITIQIKEYNSTLNSSTKYNCLISNPTLNDIVLDLDLLTQSINTFVGDLAEKFTKIQDTTTKSLALSTIQYQKLSKEIDEINKAIELKISQVNDNLRLRKDLPEAFIQECNQKAMLSIKEKIDMGMDFIINLTSIPNQTLKIKFTERFVWEYNLIVKNIGSRDLKGTKLLTMKPTLDVNKYIKTMNYKQKVDLFLSFLSKFSEESKTLFESFKSKLAITNVRTSLEINSLFNEFLILIPRNLREYNITTYKTILNFIYNNAIPSPFNDSAKNNFNKLLKSKKIEYQEIKDLVEKFNLVGGYLQSGGFIEEWETYYYQIVEMFIKINNYKTLFNNFRKTAREFNIKYIQLFNHQLYISNYIQIVLLGDTYQVYQYLSRGSVNYYRGVVSSIFQKCQDPKTVESDAVTRYFYKYHYVTLELLLNFLNNLRINWSVDFDFYKKDADADADEKKKQTEEEQSKNNSRLVVITPPELHHTDKMKKGLFIFNLFKDILDSYTYNYASPVAVYLRINDFSGQVGLQPDKPEVFKKDDKNPEKFVIENLNFCDINNEEVKKATPKTELDNLSKIIDQFSKLEFNEIFDPYGFGDNATLAMYMNIPTYLAKGKSIMMITYGYSGVGKTFTLFGKVKPPKQNGILQKALLSIQNKDAIYMRTYEIYGKALPYKSYWSNLTPDKYDHQIISYTFDSDSESGVDHAVISEESMVPYLIKIKENNSSGYSEISEEQIQNFETFIDSVDSIRMKEGRIKKTVNNPVSSRSIMVYEFKVKIPDNQYVRFVVMDLPGKEDIKSAYVYPNKTDAELKDEYCIKLKPEILEDTYLASDGIRQMSFKYNESAVRAAIFLNPLFISIFPTIATKIKTYFQEKFLSNEEFTNFIITTIGTIGTSDKKEYKVAAKKMIDFINNFSALEPIFGMNSNSERGQLEVSQEYKTKFRTCFIASEIMRFLLEKNMLREIIEFYDEHLLDVSESCRGKKSAGLPFEGFYINENILGLVNQLRKRLNPSFEVKEKDLMINYFSVNMGRRNVYKSNEFKDFENIYEEESVAQTYFIRNFLRKNIGDASTPIHLIDNSGKHLINEENNNNEENKLNYNKINYQTKGANKTIKSWLEDSYDFNKSYTNNPPIKTFMDAYFSTLPDSSANSQNWVINNFYLFYVVNNESINKCANQIKLIADSKEFISAIKNYEPEIKQKSESATSAPAQQVPASAPASAPVPEPQVPVPEPASLTSASVSTARTSASAARQSASVPQVPVPASRPSAPPKTRSSASASRPSTKK